MSDLRALPPNKLVTPGFVLRPWRLGDAALLHAAINDSRAHLEPWMHWHGAHTKVSDTLGEIRRQRARWLLDEDFVIGVLSPDGGEAWGGTGFLPRDGALGEGTTEIGMWIRSSQAGRGLGTQVLLAMLDWAFTAWWWDRVEWRCDVENHASAAVARRAGLRLEGTLRRHRVDHLGVRRDSHIFAALREEWERPGSG